MKDLQLRVDEARAKNTAEVKAAQEALEKSKKTKSRRRRSASSDEDSDENESSEEETDDPESKSSGCGDERDTPAMPEELDEDSLLESVVTCPDFVLHSLNICEQLSLEEQKEYKKRKTEVDYYFDACRFIEQLESGCTVLTQVS